MNTKRQTRIAKSEHAQESIVEPSRSAPIKGSMVIGLSLVLLGFIAGVVVGRALAMTKSIQDARLAWSAMNADRQITPTPDAKSELFNEVREEVLPKDGVTLPIRWGSWLPELVRLGVIDLDKLDASFANRGGLSAEQKQLLAQESDEFITFNLQNSWFNVTALWPLGLANKLDMNEASPIAGDNLFNFASTGGWSLGKAQNGGEYFNSYELISLTPEQEALVKDMADNTYRPCCNNSTFFQDCNHGSALLGLLELGASQGLSREELAQAALVANSYWFSQDYILTAMYFKAVKNTNWKDVDPEEILGAQYSSANGASQVKQQMAALGLIPESASGAQCVVQ